MSGDRFVLGAHGLDSGPLLQPDPAGLSSHGFHASAFTDYGLAHASIVMLK